MNQLLTWRCDKISKDKNILNKIFIVLDYVYVQKRSVE